MTGRNFCKVVPQFLENIFFVKIENCFFNNRTMKLACRYFKSTGYCVKGDYCEYSHDTATLKEKCKSLISGKTCKFGSNCLFSHDKSTEKYGTNIVRPVPLNTISNAPQKLSNNEYSFQAQVDSLQSKPQHQQQFNIDELWGFENDDNDYNPIQYTETEFSYANALNVSESTIPEGPWRQEFTPAPPMPLVCRFFIIGACKFGSFCKYSHELTENGSNFPDEAEIMSSDEIIEVECGICMSLPSDNMFGVLSNCDCVFCLTCIREWRREGIDVAKKASQVRLCPLCRTESFFVCPSQKPLRGALRQATMDAYKASMERIPCRNHQQGYCQFGNSCFYSHRNSDGVEESYKAPRALLNSDTELEYRGNNLLLSDFIEMSLSNR